MSLYPLAADYGPRVKEFLDRLSATGRLKVVASSLSTQIFGPYEEVLRVLDREMRATFDGAGKAVFILKVFGPLAAAAAGGPGA